MSTRPCAGSLFLKPAEPSSLIYVFPHDLERLTADIHLIRVQVQLTKDPITAEPAVWPAWMKALPAGGSPKGAKS